MPQDKMVERKSAWRRLPAIMVPSILLICFKVTTQAPHGSRLRGNTFEPGPFIAPPSLQQHLNVDRSLTVEKPIIYTFDASPDGDDPAKRLDQDLITAWDQAWSDSGWQTIVLNLNHAKRHPMYESINKSLDTIALDQVERIRFWRWLAMAVNGGGWLVDYNTFPLHNFNSELPNNGRLTYHEMNQAASVPSMVSGSAQEFYRLTKTELEHARTKSRAPEESKSSSSSLDFYSPSNSGLVVETMPNVVDAKYDENCEELQAKYAIQFSQLTLARNGPPLENDQHSHEDQAAEAKKWISNWRQHCRSGVVESSQPSSSSVRRRTNEYHAGMLTISRR